MHVFKWCVGLRCFWFIEEYVGFFLCVFIEGDVFVHVVKGSRYSTAERLLYVCHAIGYFQGFISNVNTELFFNETLYV